jgi:hypothetical protein
MFNCNKPTHNISIVGEWALVSDSATGCTNSGSNYSKTYQCPANSSYGCDIITFYSNGSYSVSNTPAVGSAGSPSTSSGTYSINGSKITLTSISGTVQTGTLVLSGNTLTMTSISSSTGCTEVTVMMK